MQTTCKFVSIVFFSLCLVSQATGQGKTFEVGGRLINAEDLNRQIEDIIDKASIPGISFAIIDKGEVVFYNTYGYRKVERSQNGKTKGKRTNSKTVFEACSLSKSFFVFAVHRLVDQGVLNVDTPLYRILPYPKLEHDKRYKKITARMILTHSSGIENWYFDHDAEKLEIVSEPGEKFVYSGEGFIYLSKVVELLLKKDINSYMTNLVFEPLKLERTFTTFSRNGRKPRNHAVGHDSFLAAMKKEKNLQPNIACYINTTAYDYANLLIGTFNGHYLSQKRMSDLTQPGLVLADEIYRGLGYSVYTHNGDTVLYQSGNNGAFKGFGFYSLTRKSGYAMFANGENGDQVQKILDDLTVRHDLFGPEKQYPNVVLQLLDVYNESGYSRAQDYVKKLLAENPNAVTDSELLSMGYLFLQKEPQLSAYIATEHKQRYPDSAGAVILNGKASMEARRFHEAISDFERAKVLHPGASEYLQSLISRCQELIEEKK